MTDTRGSASAEILPDGSTVKLCECGCGQPAPIATITRNKDGVKRGEPVRFVHGHYARTLKKQVHLKPCECGCGELVANRFALGHWLRSGQMKYRPPQQPIEPRFWAKVEKSDGCWLWTGGRNQDGYGKIRFRGKQTGAHRVSYILAKGEIPPGMYVMHACDNPSCVRPDHLSLGTLQENSADMVRKGRASRTGPGRPAKGEHNGAAVLTEAQVREIRSQFAAGATKRAIARQFGISDTNVRLIVTRRKWAYLEG